MTRLNYSNLPPAAQEAVQKLTGCTADELEGKEVKTEKATVITTKKAKPRSLKDLAYQAAIPLTIILIIFGLVFLLATIATSC